jgi:hypothetical protein
VPTDERHGFTCPPLIRARPFLSLTTALPAPSHSLIQPCAPPSLSLSLASLPLSPRSSVICPVSAPNAPQPSAAHPAVECAQTCAISTISDAPGCSQGDFACYCKSSQYIQANIDCAQKSCPASDLQAGIQGAVKVCQTFVSIPCLYESSAR